MSGALMAMEPAPRDRRDSGRLERRSFPPHQLVLLLFVRGLDCLNGTPLIDLKPDRTVFKPIAPPQPGDFQTDENAPPTHCPREV